MTTTSRPVASDRPVLTGRAASAGAARNRGAPGPTPVKTTQPVQGDGVTSRLPVVPWLVAGAIAVVALIAILVVFRPGTGRRRGAAASASRRERRSGRRGRRRNVPDGQPPALPAGETRTVTLNTPKGAIAIKVEADLSPIAAGNFVALASCGFYDGDVFHRTATLQDGTPFVIQGGDPTGHRNRRPRLHDQGRAGHDAVQARHRRDGPDRRAELASARSSSSSSTTRTAAVLAAPTPTRSSATSRPGWTSPTRSSPPPAASELPTNPVTVTTATVANP